MANGGAERRTSVRYPVRIPAQVTDTSTHATVNVQCTDISVGGCYMETPNPSPTGTDVRIRLEHSGSVFESSARVAYSVWAVGMGVAFEAPVPQAKLNTMKGWIADAAAAAKSKASLSSTTK